MGTLGSGDKATSLPNTKVAPSATQRPRDSDIQSNVIADVRPRPSGPAKQNSKALAALFSVAGKPGKQSEQAKQLPVSNNLNERIKNPKFESGSPSRRSKVDNRNLISGERKTRRRPSKKTDAAPSKQPRRPSKKTDTAPSKQPRRPSKTDAAPSKQPRINLQGRRGSVKDNTLDVRQQLPRKKFTSQGIPIVANIPAVRNQATNPSASQKIIPSQTNDLSKNPVAPQDPVATLARIASRKRPSKQSSQQSSSKLVKPPTNQQNFHGVVATAAKPNNKFDFDKTLKEFGFDARILSGNSFKSGPVSTPNNEPTKKPFTTFSKPAKNFEVTQTQAPSRNQVNQKSSPSFTSRGIPIISSRPKGKKNEKGLSSLIALAGKPENNPVI